MRSEPVPFEPRPTCHRCARPVSVCYCAHLPRLPTRTRVVFLQHPREADVGIGTARMAHLALPSSELHVGVELLEKRAVRTALSDPERPAVLLYPGEDAIDVGKEPPPGPVTLVVVDGTWAHARSIVRRNPELARLPRYTFVAPRPSEYRIRKEPQDEYLSTIESLAQVLGVLEGDPERFAALYAPFRAMVEAQLAYARSSSGGRHKKRSSPRRPPREAVPPIFTERRDDLVCVVTEVNAWPVGSEHRRAAHDPGELVHCVAVRIATGEVLDAIVAPRTPLSRSTPIHTELPEEALRAGGSPGALAERWRAFVRPSDLVCGWGTHMPRSLRAAGVEIENVIDVRKIARVMRSRRVGPIETFHAELGPDAGGALGMGRAGRRLGLLADVVRYLSRSGTARAGRPGTAPAEDAPIGEGETEPESRREAVDSSGGPG